MSLIMEVLNKTKRPMQLSPEAIERIQAEPSSLKDFLMSSTKKQDASPGVPGIKTETGVTTAPFFVKEEDEPASLRMWLITVPFSLILFLGLIALSYWVVNQWTIESHVQKSAMSVESVTPVSAPVGEVKTQSVSPAPVVSELEVEGIFLNGADSACIINGKVYKVGDMINQNQIIAIRQSEVLFKDVWGQHLLIKASHA